MEKFGIELDINFEYEDVYTNIFGENMLLYTIIKNININKNTKITLEEKKYLLEKTNFFNSFDTNNYYKPINIKEKINNKFSDYVVTGFQEAVFKNGKWIERYCSKNIKFKNPRYSGLYEYIGTENHICKSSDFKNNSSFNYFLESHNFNKFNYDEDFYALYHSDILIYKDGLLKILKDSLSDDIIVENSNLQNLIKYFFSDFSLDFKNDFKNIIIKIHELYNKSKKKKINFDESLKDLLNEKSLNSFFYVESKDSLVVSHSFLFNIPIINNFKTKDSFNDDDEIFFDFIANVIPLSSEKAIIIAKKELDFDIINFNIDSVNLLELSFLNTLMIDRFYRVKADAESQKTGGGDDKVHYMNNSFIFYDSDTNQNNLIDELIKKIVEGPPRSSNLEPCIIYAMKFMKNNLNLKNVNNKRILFKKILDNLYEDKK